MPVRKAAEEIADDARIEAATAHPYVSRGGVKLAAAMDGFNIAVEDRVCLDVGASTGGFSEVLLARGARRVYAVDVGRGQLHPRLRSHTRLVSFEHTDIRKLDPALLAPPPDFAVIDVSFVSLKAVIPAIEQRLAPRACLVALIKPQFEAGRGAGKKGIVRDPAVHRSVCDDIRQFLQSRGWRIGGILASPLPGGDGNREFFIEAARG